MKIELSKSEVIKIIDPELIGKLPLQESHLVEVIDPVDLLSPKRFDIMADYIYAKYKYLDAAKEWRCRVNSECRKLMASSETESNQANLIANDLNKFYEIFENLNIDDVEKEDHYLPVTDDNILIGNAHQLATSLVHQHSVNAVKFNYQPNKYDYQFFSNHGLSLDVGDSMALAFSRLCQNMVVVVVFPIARGKDDEIKDVLSAYGEIAYEKQIRFSELGRYNLIRMLYFNMHWIDPDGDITYGICHHVDHRFWRDNPVKFYFFIFDDLLRILEAKARLRALFDLKNFPVHINDTHDETVWIAEHILTPNSNFFMNHAQPWLSMKFLKYLNLFHNEINQKGLAKDKFCLIDDAVLSAFGLRDTKHINYLYFGDTTSVNLSSEFRANNNEILSQRISIDEFIFDPRNYFYFRGIKFVSPSALAELQCGQNTSKNIRDARLIDSLESESFNIYKTWRDFRFIFKKSLVKLTHIDRERLRNHVPKFIRLMLKKVFNFLSHHKKDPLDG